MPQALQEAVFKSLSLPAECGHALTIIAESAHSPLYALQNARGTPYMVFEIANGAEIADETNLRNAVSSLPTVSIGIRLLPNGSTPLILRKSFRTNDFDHIASLDPPSLLAASHSIAPSSLKPLSTRAENVLFEVHSTIRDVDGLHAPDALDEICKLVYAKLHDEETGERNGSLAFQRFSYFTVEECAAEIRQLYINAVAEDRASGPANAPMADRSRGVFREKINLSSSAISRAVELIQNYSLRSSPIDIKGRAFQNVLNPTIRAGMGQYFTPKEVIDCIVKLMRPQRGDLIIDPFCGSGHFLTSAMEHMRNELHEEDQTPDEFAFSRLYGIEKSDRMVRIATTDMRLHGDEYSRIKCADSLLPFRNYPDIHREAFDLVMTNPPFGIDLPADTISQLGPFSLAADRKNSISLEILAIERCLQLLKPGGRLAIVLPDSILSNRNTEYVREWINQHARVTAIISLPIETFSPFGAHIKTSVLLLQKLGHGEAPIEREKVFLADIATVGYDSSGRPTKANELTALVEAFHAFADEENI